MKKFLAGLTLMAGLAVASAQQTHPNSHSGQTTTTRQTVKKETKPAPSQKLKSDGTPDRRYKENKHLKKDGTADKRYKEHK